MNPITSHLRFKSLTFAGFLLLSNVSSLVVSVSAEVVKNIKPAIAETSYILSLDRRTFDNQKQLRSKVSPQRNTNENRGLAKQVKGPVRKNNGDGGGKGKHMGGDACPFVTPVVTALVPTYQTSAGDVTQDDTLEERPTFWVYVPYALTANVPGELQLLEPDSAGGMTYNPVATVTGTAPGVVGVRLPSNRRLNENQQIQWRFRIICDRRDSTANPYTDAAVVRRPKDPALQRRIQQANPEQLVAIYQQQGLWYDVAARLARLRQQKPADARLSSNWRRLLDRGGLSVFTSKPIDRKAP